MAGIFVFAGKAFQALKNGRVEVSFAFKGQQDARSLWFSLLSEICRPHPQRRGYQPSMVSVIMSASDRFEETVASDVWVEPVLGCRFEQ